MRIGGVGSVAKSVQTSSPTLEMRIELSNSFIRCCSGNPKMYKSTKPY